MPLRVVVSSSSSSSSIAAMKGSIGAVVGCDRVFRGVVRDAVAFNFFSSTRVTKSYLLALGTTQISSYFTKHLIDNSTKVILDGFETKHVTG